MKSLKSKIAASALALSLAGGVFVTNPTTAEAAGKPLYIKKVLNLPKDGVTTPVETFTFKFTAHSKNRDETKASDLPAVSDVTIAYSATDNNDNNDKTEDGKQLIKESTDALANVKWTESGQFTYTVTEFVDENSETDYMTYSKASYLVSVFVGKTDDGKEYEVKDIQIMKLKDDAGTAIEKTKKEGYQPGTGDDKEGNNFAFENNYDKEAGNKKPGGGSEITDDDKKGFVLRKTVDDKSNDDFKFKLTVEKPVGSNSSEEAKFTYKIVNKEGKAGEEKTGTYGTSVEDIVLKHNERLVFTKVLLGSKVTVEETDSGRYEGSVLSSSFNGTAGTDKSGVIGDQEGGNFVEYINKTQTPTGLLVDNLPFIALVAVAGAGIAFFIKGKKEDEEALA